MRVARGKQLGRVYYTVQSELDPVSFAKRKDAEELKSVLRRATVPIKSAIVRREVTDEGYIPTYGDSK